MEPTGAGEPAPPNAYEPPRIEARWSAIELEREILYAGPAPGSSPAGI
jgi:hypothetical protein